MRHTLGRQLAERLDDIFAVLSRRHALRAGPPSGPARRPWTGATTCSTADERAAFRRLAVFFGGFSCTPPNGRRRRRHPPGGDAGTADPAGRQVVAAGGARPRRLALLLSGHYQDYARERLIEASNPTWRAGSPGVLHRVRGVGRGPDRSSKGRRRAWKPSSTVSTTNCRTSGGRSNSPRKRTPGRGAADRRPAGPLRLPSRSLPRDPAVDGRWRYLLPGRGRRSSEPERCTAAAGSRSSSATTRPPSGGSTPRCCSTGSSATRPGWRLPAGARQRRARAGPVRSVRAVARGRPRTGQGRRGRARAGKRAQLPRVRLVAAR